jgi:DNA polymerase I-like protein with 3'-5' exonuclease and polymerase domains
MDIYTIDFETYYAKDYGLNKLTTEEYIRDPRFEVIGVAVKKNDEETQWFSGTKAQTQRWLDQFPWEDNIALAHNGMFDFAIMAWHFDIHPKKLADTLCMARALHTIEVGGSLAALSQYYNLGKKGTEVVNALGLKRLDFPKAQMQAYAGYCINDVDLTYALFEILIKRFPVSELNLVDLTLRMFTRPVIELNKYILREHLQVVKENKERLMSVISQSREELMSNDKFATALRVAGVEPPTKISPTTGRETYAFAKADEAFKALLEHENEAVQALVSARLGVKSTIEETRTQRFIEIAARGTLPIPLRYYAAHTGRWGGDDKVNLQNLPRMSAIKQAMEAPIGYKLIDSDSSQIEARTLAWLAGQDDLVAAFDKGEDVYKIMASAIYGKEVEEITKDERFVGKTTILGAGYGMGAAKFRTQLKTFGVDLSAEECNRVITVYRETYPCIPKLWREAGNALNAIERDQTTPLGRGLALTVEGKHGIRLPNGFYIKYPNLRRQVNEEGRDEMVYDTKKGRTTVPNRIYGGKVVENVCQALARIVIGEQMLRIAKKYQVVMTVHDAVCCVVPEEEADTAREYVELCMRLRPEWASELPLDCESGVGDSYGDCK